MKQSLTLTTNVPIVAMLTKQTNEMTGGKELSAHTVRPVAKTTTLHKTFFAANAAS